MTIQKDVFGTTPEGATVERYTIENGNGVAVQLMNLGAHLLSCRTPDRSDNSAEVTLTFSALAPFFGKYPYFGASVGRFANRIAAGTFVLDGKTYKLAVNDGRNHLHGGDIGFNRHIWKSEAFGNPSDAGVVFSRRSPHGEEGYPGNLDAQIVYTLNEENELIIDYVARTDRATPVNLTNHTYWNLSGQPGTTVLDHELFIASDKYLPVDDGSIPLGDPATLDGSPMGFQEPKTIGRDIAKVGGYDHCYLLRDDGGQPLPGALEGDLTGRMRQAARLTHPGTGRSLEILTTMPGLQLYTGNYLDGFSMQDGRVLTVHAALCLETEYYPDSVNRPYYPSPVLRRDQSYRHRTIHRFSVA